MKGICSKQASIQGLFIVAAFLLSAAQALGAARRYAVTDLGTLGGAVSEGKAINNRGQIVGVSSTNLTGPVVTRAFIYREGRMIGLGTLGGTNSVANAINSSGQVAGTAQTTNQLNHAFVYDGRAMTDLGALLESSGQPFVNSYAFGLNDAGDVVGSYSERPPLNAFLFSQGVMKPLGALGGSSSEAADINNRAQATGRSVDSNGDPRAYIYAEGLMSALGPKDSPLLYPRAINDRSQVAGYGYEPGTDSFRAYLWSEGAIENLAVLPGMTFSVPMGLNNFGHVVGYSGTNSDSHLSDRGCVWIDGEMFDVNDLIDADSGWTIYEAVGINDNGQIVANGFGPTGHRALLLTPRPELQSLLLNHGSVDLQIAGMTGVTYRVEMALSLPAATWNFLTNFVIDSIPAIVADDNPPASGTRFYRVVQPPF